MNNYYPEIDQGYLVPFDVILAGMTDDPLWLERDECPYDQQTKATLRSFVKRLVINEEPKPGVEDYQPLTNDELERDLAKLHSELRDFKSSGIGENDIAYFRVAVALMAKIVDMRERMLGVKTVGDFQNKVIQVFENVMTPEQATRAINLLGAK